MSLQITAIILVKNEERHIVDCIKRLNFCDEILIIDDRSTDKTVESIARLNNKKVRIIPYSLRDDFSKARNFGLSQANGKWVLFIDADEIVSDALAFETSSVTHQLGSQPLARCNGFYIKRKDFMWGKTLNFGEAGNIKLLRLAKRSAGEWNGKVHEKWTVGGDIGVLKNYLIHYPHQTITEFLKEINYYTDIRAQELHSKNVKAKWWSIVFYPSAKFISNYILKRGFLDGMQGLIFAIIMSFHSFLVRGKLFLKNDR